MSSKLSSLVVSQASHFVRLSPRSFVAYTVHVVSYKWINVQEKCFVRDCVIEKREEIPSGDNRVSSVLALQVCGAIFVRMAEVGSEHTSTSRPRARVSVRQRSAAAAPGVIHCRPFIKSKVLVEL